MDVTKYNSLWGTDISQEELDTIDTNSYYAQEQLAKKQKVSRFTR